MTRINTNIASLRAQRTLGRNNSDLNMRLERLSTGLKVNTGKDGPAALIASETMRSEIEGLRQAIDNSARANNVINTAEGALAEVSNLLLQVQSLTNEAANTGALSDAEIEANQLQVDEIINSINRISNTTQFNGRMLLNGQLDYRTSGVSTTNVTDVKINSAMVPDGGSINVAVEVTAAAEKAQLSYTGTAMSADATLEIGGQFGIERLTFTSGTAISAVAFAVNQVTSVTGVTASAAGSALVFNSSEYGSNQFVTVEAISGNFAVSANEDTGVDATATINGVAAEVDGLYAKVRNSNLDIEVDLTETAGTVATTTSFNITGGGTRFQIGSQIQNQAQIAIGIGSVNTTQLGNNTVGFLSELSSGGSNSLIGGNTMQAQRILEEAISEVATLRGRLGALQRNVLETNINSLQIAMENTTAAESTIRDADFATETAKLPRAQILAQANTSVLAQANAQPQQVLALLGA